MPLHAPMASIEQAASDLTARRRFASTRTVPTIITAATIIAEGLIALLGRTEPVALVRMERLSSADHTESGHQPVGSFSAAYPQV